MEVRTVRFNIREFLEDYLCLQVSGEEEQSEEALERFKSFLDGCKPTIRVQVIKYVKASPIVKGHKKIRATMLEIIKQFS